MTDSSDLAIVSAIIAIARHLHIQVIAEGIEAYQQAEILRKLGCSVGQGFLFARPMPADQCLDIAEQRALGVREEEDMLAVSPPGALELPQFAGPAAAALRCSRAAAQPFVQQQIRTRGR